MMNKILINWPGFNWEAGQQVIGEFIKRLARQVNEAVTRIFVAELNRGKLGLMFGVLAITALLFLVYTDKTSTPSQAQSATPDATLAPQDVTFPDLTGPYKVGRTEYEWVDQSRDETFASIPGLKRDLMVYVWFPASVTKRTKIAPYMDGDLTWDNSILGRGFGHPGLDSLVHSHAYSTSLPDTTQTGYPVIIFVPGYGITGLLYESVLEEIASHGYIVIATSHPYSTDVITYPDGRLVVGGAVAQAHDPESSPVVPAILTQDARFVINQAESLNATDKYFKGQLDMSRVALLSHRFGAQASAELTAADPRVKAGVVIDGEATSGFALPDPGRNPVLFIGPFPGPAQQTQDKYLLRIDGFDRRNLTDYPFLVPLIPEIPADGYLGDIDPARGHQIVSGYLLTFFDHYLKGADLAWPTYPEAHLTPLRSLATAANR
jgi:hypothetical protein